MGAYVVTFLNRLCDSTGHEQKVCQRRVIIRTARSRERAIEAAKKRFARAEHIHDWTIHAHEIEVEKVGEGERLA